MRTTALVTGLLIAVLGRPATTAQAVPQAPSTGSTTITIDALTHRVMQAEAALTVRMQAFRPIVEVYVQYVEPHAQLGTVPARDDYYLGEFEWNGFDGPRIKGPEKGKLEGFAAATVPDWRLLSTKQHTFTYLRREFLGDVRCVVLDVAPRADSVGGFTGRIWVEDREFNIVRFNGTTRGVGKKAWLNVDSWRANVKPGMWLPSYVYLEQQSDAGPTIKSHMRLWGYDLKPFQQPLGEIAVAGDARPEATILDSMAKAGVLAPPGEVDKVLETVLMNLQITNNLTIERVQARVLLTSPMVSFSVGRTVLLSRGLIDVLPDEASLATMLAHELAHILLGHGGHSVIEEGAAEAKAQELLKNSPYKDKLTEAALFLRAVNENSKKLPNLITSHMIGRALMQNAQALSPERLDQVAALPLGARVVIDPWTGGLELSRAATVPLQSAREKASLAVTPLVPYLRYAAAHP